MCFSHFWNLTCHITIRFVALVLCLHTFSLDAVGPEAVDVSLVRPVASGPVLTTPALRAEASLDDVFIGSNDGLMRRVAGNLSQTRWSFQTSGSVQSSPLFACGMVYFGSNDGYAYAVDERTGILRWFYQTEAPITGSPTLLPLGEAPEQLAIAITSQDGTITSLNSMTGQVNWAVNTGAAIPSRALCVQVAQQNSLAAAEYSVIVGNEAGEVFSFNAVTGVQNWVSTMTGPVILDPAFLAVAPERILVAVEPNTLVGLNPVDGAAQASFNPATQIVSAPVATAKEITSSLDDEVMIETGIFFGAVGGKVYKLDSDFNLAWLAEGLPDLYGGIASTTVDPRVYVATGNITALDWTTGETVWNLPEGSPDLVRPAIGEGFLYAGCYGGEVVVVR